MKYMTPVSSILLSVVLLWFCTKSPDEPEVISSNQLKMNGVSFAAPNYEFGSSELDPVKELNANYVCLMPFAFGQPGSPELTFDREFQWWGEKTEGILASIEFARDRGLKILLKPHVWFWHGSFTGDFSLENEEDWQIFESNYENYIMHFAKLADSAGIELFCMGVEFENFVEQRPQFWNNLIQKVRTVYDGDLTYAANWDNFKDIGFWQNLDYIGIDAYFPVSPNKTPNLFSLLNGWDNHFASIKNMHEQYNKPVLFTEFGYKSIDFTGKEPWDPEDGDVNLTAQKNAYKAVFKKFWDKPWFAGGFLWKWYANHSDVGGIDNKDYTPQNKPVQEIIYKHFSK